MKKINHKLTLIVLLIISICTLGGVGITYSKFVFKQDTSKTIVVPEYTQCLSLGSSTLSECILINENDFYETATGAKTDLKTKKADFTKVPTTDEGMFMAEDDSGESYYFRGNAVDNYVSYAGFIWRIIRVNGDGSVRMIYAGTSALSTGADTTIGTTKYNTSDITDMALLGYKYGLTQSKKTYSSVNHEIDLTKSYYFSSDYSTDNTNKRFTLNGSGDAHGLWENIFGKVNGASWNTGDSIWDWWTVPSTTCFRETKTETCNIIFKAEKTKNKTMPTSVPGEYEAFISSNYAATLTNENSSTIKTTLENWYQTNIVNSLDASGNSYASYVADNKFCNDRSLSSGDGNTLSADSIYASYNRNTNNKTPSLKCSQSQDGFSSTTAKGNGGLTYPVGLITADELAMSGVVAGSEASGSFLNTGVSYWTMSPGYFSVTKLTENNYIMNSTGILTTEQIKNESAIRPVINLSSTVKVTKGNGTMTNPYQVSLN